MMRLTIRCFSLVLALSAVCRAADFQAKTADGQVIQGEYLGTEDGIVKIKTIYGMVAIPSKDIITLSALEAAPKPDAPQPVPQPSLTPVITSNTDDSKNAGLTFKEPKGVAISSLLASRMPPIPEAVKQHRIDLVRQIRNFSDSSDLSRNRIIRQLQNFGLTAYPFIEAAYTGPNDLFDKVELLQAVALPHHPYCAMIISTTHADAVSELGRIANSPPPLPPEILTKDRNRTPTRAQMQRNMARLVRSLEGYASIAGGPFNTLFLLRVYKERYGGESDPLLHDVMADRQRLATVVGDLKNKADAWLPEDRPMLIDLALPLHFKKTDDLREVVQDLLKKILPDKHPKWDAPEAEWVEWWMKAKDELLKK